MTGRVSDSQGMVAGMSPALLDGVFVFVTTDDPHTQQILFPQARASFREAEGWSFIVTVDLARQQNLPVEQQMRQITLNVLSDLEGVGLTAAVSGVLADHGIAANVVAAYRHDHIFVPAARAEDALALLQTLQAQAASRKARFRSS